MRARCTPRNSGALPEPRSNVLQTHSFFFGGRQLALRTEMRRGRTPRVRRVGQARRARLETTSYWLIESGVSWAPAHFLVHVQTNSTRHLAQDSLPRKTSIISSPVGTPPHVLPASRSRTRKNKGKKTKPPKLFIPSFRETYSDVFLVEPAKIRWRSAVGRKRRNAIVAPPAACLGPPTSRGKLAT